MKKIKQPRFASLLIFGLTILFLALCFLYKIISDIYPGIFDCRFYSTFGFYCPGCGGSRAFFSLISFCVVKSFIYNPLVLIFSLFLLDINIRALISLIHNDIKYIKGFHGKSTLIIPIILIIYFVIRNLLLYHGIDLMVFAGRLRF